MRPSWAIFLQDPTHNVGKSKVLQHAPRETVTFIKQGPGLKEEWLELEAIRGKIETDEENLSGQGILCRVARTSIGLSPLVPQLGEKPGT